MLFISHNPIYINALADEWVERLETYLTEVGHSYSVSYPNPTKPTEQLVEECETYQAKMLCKIKHSALSTADKKIATAIVNRFVKRLKYYAKTGEEDLAHIHSMCLLLKVNHPDLHNVLKDIYTDLYGDFVSVKNVPSDIGIPISYYFVEKLQIRTCPYCNRTYTFNIYDKEGRKARPEYDHFYDKADNPLLAVSFYNLVPSCPICNHIKTTNSLSINPFFHGFKGVFRVCETKKDADRLKHDVPQPISLAQLFNHNEWGDIRLYSAPADESADMQTLGLDEFYKRHKDYAEEIIEKVNAYNPSMMVALTSTFQGAGYSPQQVFDFVWGKHISEAKQINRPLSKLKHDILEQAGIINADEQ